MAILKKSFKNKQTSHTPNEEIWYSWATQYANYDHVIEQLCCVYMYVGVSISCDLGEF